MDALLTRIRSQVLDLFAGLGLDETQRLEVLKSLADSVPKQEVITREELIARDIPELIPYLKKLADSDLARAFLCMFPTGNPNLVGNRTDLTAFIEAAVVQQRAIKGLAVTV